MADKRVWIADRSKHKTYQEAVRKAKAAKRTPPGRWRVHWIDPEGKERNKTFQTLGAEDGQREDTAHWWRRKMERELNGDAGAVYIDPDAGDTPFGDLAWSWWEACDVKKSSKRRYKDHLTIHIIPKWEHVPVRAVSDMAIAGWLPRLKRGGGLTDDDNDKLGASAKRSIFTIMSAVLDWSVPEYIPANPLRGSKKAKRPKPKKIHDHAYLDYLEVESLADAADGLLTKYGHPAAGVPERVHSTLIRSLAYTGMRPGEALAMKVKHAVHDSPKPVFEIRSTLIEDDRTAEVYLDVPKDHEARDSPMPQSLLEDIAALCVGKNPDDFVFSADGKTPLRLRNWRTRVFNRARAAAKLPDKLTPHKLRHTAASLAIRAGASVLSVQRLLGHASPTETLRTYAHLWEDEVWKVADALDRGRVDAIAGQEDAGSLVGMVADLVERLAAVQALLEAVGMDAESEALHRELERLETGARDSQEFLEEVAAGVDAGRLSALAG
jgi:integrase